MLARMQTIRLELKGLKCDACVHRTTQALLEVKGVRSARVQQDQATVEFEGTEQSKLIEAVNAAGYEAAVTG
jgi:copper chaperone CopZ